MADQPQNEKPNDSTNSDPQKVRIEALEKENASLLKETLSKKEHIRELETKKQAEEAERLKEQNKFKELYEGTIPKAKRAEEIEPVINSLLELEVADVPEDKRELIPQFEKPEQKLLWVRNAKAKGLFAVPDQSTQNPASTVQSKVKTEGTLPDFVSWPSNDPRLSKLTTDQYRIWKAHNTKTVTGIRGWGGG